MFTLFLKTEEFQNINRINIYRTAIINYKSQFNSENEFLTASLIYGKIIVNLVRPSFPV